MRVPVFEIIGGSTIVLTWVNSGVTPTSLKLNVLDKSETLVSSVTPVDSGNGHYFAPLYVPKSDPWYVAHAIAVIDANTYVKRGLIRTVKLETD